MIDFYVCLLVNAKINANLYTYLAKLNYTK